MATSQIKGRMAQKADTEANWSKATAFVPLKGEICVYLADDTYSYPRIKVGDGNTLVSNLPFSNPEALSETEIDEACGLVQFASEVEF